MHYPAARPIRSYVARNSIVVQDDCELEAVVFPAPGASPNMSDQIIDALMACAIHAIAARTHAWVGWIVMRDQPDYPDEMIGRLVTDAPTPYVLRGHTLAEVQAQLPPGLEPSERQPSDPPEVVEVWHPRCRS
jgi:hypothetical protein